MAPVSLTVIKWSQRLGAKQLRQLVQHCLLPFFWLQKQSNHSEHLFSLLRRHKSHTCVVTVAIGLGNKPLGRQMSGRQILHLNLYSTNPNNDHNSTNPNPKPNLNLVSPKCLHTFVTNTIYTACRKASHILFSLITISQQLPSSNVKSLKIHVPPRRQLSTFCISLLLQNDSAKKESMTNINHQCLML